MKYRDLALVGLMIFFLTLMSSVASEVVCPVSLSNPDGQAMELEKYDVRVAVHGALSLTEIEMVFRNPMPRQMEGRFLCLLPPGATLSRFAKEVSGRLMEGEVVERMRAQSVYTSILQTMRDPALLEMDQGNRFSARVFPIPAGGTVRLILSYSRLLSLTGAERKLSIPMLGMPKIKDFSFSATGRKLPGEAATAQINEKTEKIDSDDLAAAAWHLKDFTPQKDIELSFKPATDAPAVQAIKSGNYQMLSIRPEVPALNIEKGNDWVFYFDTSASNADTEARRLQASESLLIGLVPVLREKDNLFQAFAFDLDVVPILAPVSMNSKGGRPIMPEVVNSLRARHSLGATNLEAALKHIGEQARAKTGQCRFVIVTDGIPTLGAREVRDLQAALGEWPQNAVLHALVLGSKYDDKILNAIVEKTHGRVVTLALNGQENDAVSSVLSELQMPVGAAFELYDEGAAWIYPRTFTDVRPGSELIVFSELRNGQASKPGLIQRGADGKVVNDRQLALSPVEIPGFGPLLQREACRAFLDHLEKQEQSESNAGKRDEIHKQRIEVSTKNRVLCPLTSLLVLESENDYQRFGIERTSLADVMIVGKSGIELLKRVADDTIFPAKNLRSGTRKNSEVEKKKDESAKLTEGNRDTFKELSGRGKEANDAVDASEETVERSLGGNDGTPRQMQLAAVTGAPDPAAAAAAPGHLPIAPQAATPTDSARQSAHDRPFRARLRSESAAESGVNRSNENSASPDWTAQYTNIPSEQQLTELQNQVAGHTRDRGLRNAYANALLKAQKWDTLQGQVFEWLPFDPENPQVYEYLGYSAAKLGSPELALRAFTSIAEIAPNRAALLARSGWLLMTANKYAMAQEMFKLALKNRADDCNIYRGLALSYWLDGRLDDAAKVLEEALPKEFDTRYGDVKRVMREELGYIYRVWTKNSPLQADAIKSRAQKSGVNLAATDALRVTMCWETDANDVDLHIVDPNGEECFYGHMKNVSGLELYSDQTQGLGPEVIRTEKALPGTYHIGVNYFNAGPMGVSRGVVVIMKPENGVIEHPIIVPFCLIPDGPPIRHLGLAKF